MSFSTKSTTFTFVNYLLLIGTGLIWGSLYGLNKFALESFSPSMIAAGRTGIGIITLTLLTMVMGKRSGSLPSKPAFLPHLRDFILIGFLEATLPCILITWAQQQLPVSITAILMGSVPLLTTLMESFFVEQRAPSPKKIDGILLGFFGILVLIRPELFTSKPFSSSISSLPLLPVFAVLAACLCFSIITILIKARLSTHFAPMALSRGMVLGTLFTALPLMLCLTKPWTITSFHPTHAALLSLILLGIFAGALVYLLYVRLINRAGPAFASFCNYFVAPVGAFIGIAFMGEKLTIALTCSLIMILFSVLFLSENHAQQAEAENHLQ